MRQSVEIRTLFDTQQQPVQHTAGVQLFDASRQFSATALRQTDGSWAVTDSLGTSATCTCSEAAAALLKSWRATEISRQYAAYLEN